MLFPSGDQAGLSLLEASKVNRVDVPRTASTIQISRAPFAPSEAATRIPSGDTAGFPYSPASPTVPTGFPLWSNHASASLVLPAPPR